MGRHYTENWSAMRSEKVIALTASNEVAPLEAITLPVLQARTKARTASEGGRP